MSTRSHQQALGTGRVGSAALLAFAMVLGYIAYPWIAPGREEPHGQDAHPHGVDAGRAGEGGTIRIPVDLQRGNGLEIRRAEVRQFETSLHVTGTVSADETRVARIRPPARGVVEEVLVHLGGRVNAGDPVVMYDNIDLGLAVGEFLAAIADLASTRTTLDVNETLLARSREMLAVEAVARTEHDLLEAEFRSAQAQVDGARALVAKFEEQLHRFGLTEEDLSKLGTGEDTSYHRTVSRTALRTPSAGIVTSHDVLRGDIIDPSSELLTITDISVVWILADVSERDLSAIRVGKPVSIRASSYPDQTFLGRIAYSGDVVEPGTRTARVRCVVRNPDALLKLGMFATVDIPTGITYDALAVPSSAIQEIQGEPVVFVQRSNDEFERRRVRIGLESDDWIEVGSGVGTGDAVITGGSSLAKAAALRTVLGAGH